ncbi:hypothetical protein [Streptantibioticus cattleyicolor]|nr:hypothetical protein [Streptantibioticus cattleyicolor]
MTSAATPRGTGAVREGRSGTTRAVSVLAGLLAVGVVTAGCADASGYGSARHPAVIGSPALLERDARTLILRWTADHFDNCADQAVAIATV